MNDEQSEALSMADMLDFEALHWGTPELPKAAAKVRRLHALNGELLQALKLAQSIIGHPDDAHSQHIAAVIARAEGEKT
jgi:hypothetical protein